MLSKNQVVKVRKALEAMYIGALDLVIKEEYKKDNGATAFRDVTILSAEPCELSHKDAPVSGDSASASSLSQQIKVFVAPEIKIPPGSKMIITQNGVTEEYKNSGNPQVFQTHQEITLELLKEWS